MNLAKLLGVMVSTWLAAGVLSFVMMLVGAGLAGRGTSRMGWVIPLVWGTIFLLFASSAVVVGLASFRLASTTAARVIPTVVYAVFGLASFVGLAVMALVLYNR